MVQNWFRSLHACPLLVLLSLLVYITSYYTVSSPMLHPPRINGFALNSWFTLFPHLCCCWSSFSPQFREDLPPQKLCLYPASFVVWPKVVPKHPVTIVVNSWSPHDTQLSDSVSIYWLCSPITRATVPAFLTRVFSHSFFLTGIFLINDDLFTPTIHAYLSTELLRPTVGKTFKFISPWVAPTQLFGPLFFPLFHYLI